MNTVEIGKVYRHFKGNYYFVENIAYDSESIWVRPEKMFLEEIPKRPDNITGQKHRFELVENLTNNFLK